MAATSHRLLWALMSSLPHSDQARVCLGFAPRPTFAPSPSLISLPLQSPNLPMPGQVPATQQNCGCAGRALPSSSCSSTRAGPLLSNGSIFVVLIILQHCSFPSHYCWGEGVIRRLRCPGDGGGRWPGRGELGTQLSSAGVAHPSSDKTVRSLSAGCRVTTRAHRLFWLFLLPEADPPLLKQRGRDISRFKDRENRTAIQIPCVNLSGTKNVSG